MSKLNVILEKFKRMNLLLSISLISSLVIDLLLFLYATIVIGMNNDIFIYFIYYCVLIPFILYGLMFLFIKIKYKKMSILLIYNKKSVEDAIDYLLNGLDYNKEINDIYKNINKNKISDNDIIKIILNNDNLIRSHFNIIKISKIIRKLEESYV